MCSLIGSIGIWANVSVIYGYIRFNASIKINQLQIDISVATTAFCMRTRHFTSKSFMTSKNETVFLHNEHFNCLILLLHRRSELFFEQRICKKFCFYGKSELRNDSRHFHAWSHSRFFFCQLLKEKKTKRLNVQNRNINIKIVIILHIYALQVICSSDDELNQQSRLSFIESVICGTRFFSFARRNHRSMFRSITLRIKVNIFSMSIASLSL